MRKVIIIVVFALLLNLSCSAIASANTQYPGASNSLWLPGSNLATPLAIPLNIALPVISRIIVGKTIDSIHTYDMTPGFYDGQRGYWTRYGEFIPAID